MSLHTITLNGENLLLFLAPVDWSEGVAIKLLPEGSKDWDDTLFKLTGVGVH